MNSSQTTISCEDVPLQPGCSAVWQMEYEWFYVIHGTAIFVISISIVACIIVISAIIRKYKQEDNPGFSERFPLYIAINDLIWGISHIIDHTLLLVTQVYPDKLTLVLLSSASCSAFAYQQVMYAAISLYTYLKIVRKSSINFGKWEWKLQVLCWLIVITSTSLWHYLGTIGVARYWVGFTEGQAGPFAYLLLSLFSSFQAGSVVFCFSRIRKTVITQREDLASTKSSTVHNSYHQTAYECLSTFVSIGVFLYVPTAILFWTSNIAHLLGISMLDMIWPMPAMVALLNCGGFVNALGFFRNRHIKLRNKKPRIGAQSAASKTTGSSQIVA